MEGAPGRGWAAGQFLRVVDNLASPIISETHPPGTDCQPGIFPGITYCRRDGGETHSILIDLDNPHIGIETGIAQDQNSVNTNARELVSSIAARHEAEGVVTAINADYFGAGHGPEGLTIVNGLRLDGPLNNDDDNNAVNRSAWVFGKPTIDGGSGSVSARVNRLQIDAITLDPNQFFNAVGGWPQVMLSGQWDWTRGRDHPLYRDCPADILDSDVINGECFRGTGDWDAPDKSWTVIGVNGDNQLMLLVTAYPNVRSNLEAFSIQNAIKLDGGGSPQIWYNGRDVVSSTRSVADGLLFFYKCDYQVIEQSQWPVVIEGEGATLNLSLRNTGADTWSPSSYALVSDNNPWDATLQFSPGNDIGPGGVMNWEWRSHPFNTWGIKTLEFHMAEIGVLFPSQTVRIAIIVIPQELADRKEEL